MTEGERVKLETEEEKLCFKLINDFLFYFILFYFLNQVLLCQREALSYTLQHTGEIVGGRTGSKQTLGDHID